MASETSTTEVQDHAVAAFLTDPRRFSWFAPFLAQTRSLSGAARDLDRSVQLVAYHVREMLTLGLLRRVPNPPGARGTFYRSVSDEFVVPFALMPFETLAEERRAIDEPMQALLVRHVAAALGRSRDAELVRRFGRDERGTVQLSTLRQPRDQQEIEAPLLSLWQTLVLTPKQARELRNLMLSWYETPPAPNGARYLLRVALVPLADGDDGPTP